MALPCDDVHWHWGPAVTGEVSRSLHQVGWQGSEIAKVLGLTPAAVSYYIKYKRGTQPLPPSAMNACMRLCQKIAGKKIKDGKIPFEMARIAVMARHEGQPAQAAEMVSICKSCLSPRLQKGKMAAAH